MSKYGKATIDNLDVIIEEMENSVSDINVYERNAKRKAYEAIHDICNGIDYEDIMIKNDEWGNRSIYVIIACLDGIEEVDGEEFPDWSIRRIQIS